MEASQLKQRLEERRVCESEHLELCVPHNGFGWTGWRCVRCGFMFFGRWEESSPYGQT
jgi:hypothetical protein